DNQHDGSHANSKAVFKPERFHGIVSQNRPHQVGEAQKVTMKVLHNQREAAFAEIGLPRLADRARWRIGPEGLVVSATIVITGETEEARNPKDEQRRRKRQKARIPGRLRTEPG